MRVNASSPRQIAYPAHRGVEDVDLQLALGSRSIQGSEIAPEASAAVESLERSSLYCDPPEEGLRAVRGMFFGGVLGAVWWGLVLGVGYLVLRAVS